VDRPRGPGQAHEAHPPLAECASHRAIEQADLSTDLYFNDPRAALAAEQAKSSKTKGKRRALDLGDEGVERQRALLLQQRQKQRRSSGHHDNDEGEGSSSSAAVAVRVEKEKEGAETKAAKTHLYTVYIVTPSWDKDDERAQRQQGNRLLNPTFEEAHAAEPYEVIPRMTWEAVVTLFANPSEIGRNKLYDPLVRPIALVAGGRLTVHRRRYKGGSHPDKGFIRVVADERFGYDARAAYVEARMREWRTVMRTRTLQPDALGYWTRAAATQPSSRRPRTRPSITSTTSTPRSAIGSSRGRTSRKSSARAALVELFVVVARALCASWRG
jgi:hypothetical protein